MPYWIAVHLPRLPLDALQPTWPEPAGAVPTVTTLQHMLPAVVLERERVILANRPAMDLGVQAGMRRGGVQALSADVVQLERDPAAEAGLLTSVALALLRFTPAVTFDDAPEAATVMLDLSASLRLFGGHRALCRAVRRCVRQLGTFAQIGCGTTAQGAAWLARQPLRRSRRGLVRPARRAIGEARTVRLLDGLPVTLLADFTDPDWLDGIGCRTLGEVRRLPRAGLARRLGEGVLARLDQAYGEVPVRHAWFAAPPAFSQRMDLPGRIESAEGVLAGAQRLLQALAGWLTAQQAGVTRWVLVMEHERYRRPVAALLEDPRRPRTGGGPASLPAPEKVTGSPPARGRREEADQTAVPIGLAQPSRDPDHLSRLLREKLDRLQFHAPVTGLALTVETMEGCLPQTDSLFPEPGGTPAEFGRLLDTLMARLGRDNVLQPRPLADHRPERANRWCPVDEAVPRAERMRADVPGPERPLWLLPQPLPLPVRQHRPHHGGPLVLLTRAERIESGWWDGGLATRDYFVAERADGLRCWVFRERPDHGEAEGGSEYRWFLHGLFA